MQRRPGELFARNLQLASDQLRVAAYALRKAGGREAEPGAELDPRQRHKLDFVTRQAVEDWIEGAEWHEGSWWPYWHQWLRRRSGARIPARVPGQGNLLVIEDAPGRYVRMK